MAKYIRQPSPYNTQIVALGVDTYLKMLLHDNFVVGTSTHMVLKRCSLRRTYILRKRHFLDSHFDLRGAFVPVAGTCRSWK